MNYIEFYEYYLAKSKRNSIIYRILFYAMNIASFALIFYVALISVFHLAAVSSLKSWTSALDPTTTSGAAADEVLPGYLETINKIIDAISIGTAGTGTFPITTTIVGSISSAIIGLVSFFYVSDNYKKAVARLGKLKFEKLQYDLFLGKYVDASKRDLNFYEEVIKIVNYINVKAMRSYE